MYKRSRRSGFFYGLWNFFLLLAAVGLLAITGVLFVRGITHPDENHISAKDGIPPEIVGVSDFLVYQGDTISYRTGITVSDNLDESPVLTVDSSRVDLNTPGNYSVVYQAEDSSGNITTQTASVTVLKKLPGYADLDTIYAAADELLQQILGPGGSTATQVRNIYTWARVSLYYGGQSDRTDWRQTAYLMLSEHRGDCFGYYAVTKLLFERLGIPNIDVRKVPNSETDSDHFWSLVSVDGGETYYHFDATPRVGDGDDFCLVTDAFLDDYSSRNNGSHNRDTSLYPATPEVNCP